MEKRPPSGTAIAEAVLKECAALGLAPREVYPGIIVTNGGFAKTVLGIDPATFIESLDTRVPLVGEGDIIQPGALQWVTGENVNLHYRGKALPRRKISRGLTGAHGGSRHNLHTLYTQTLEMRRSTIVHADPLTIVACTYRSGSTSHYVSTQKRYREYTKGGRGPF